MNVWDYFHQRERELAELSLAPEPDFWHGVAEEEGSDGQHGKMLLTATLAENAYLGISETVEVVDDHVHRIDYAYFLVIDGEEVWGEERDPTHDPPVHGHYGPDHARVASEGISFRAAAERAWEEITRRAELGEQRL